MEVNRTLEAVSYAATQELLIMEREGSLPCSQELSTNHSSEPDQYAQVRGVLGHFLTILFFKVRHC
jgi:hypothetical protein